MQQKTSLKNKNRNINILSILLGIFLIFLFLFTATVYIYFYVFVKHTIEFKENIREVLKQCDTEVGIVKLLHVTCLKFITIINIGV